MNRKKVSFRKKGIARGGLVAATLLFLSLSGCGGKNVAGGSAANGNKAVLLTHEEQAILDYVDGTSYGKLTEDDYLYLAKLYKDRKRFGDRRNVLEDCVRTLGSQKAMEEIESFWVNLQEEDPALLEAAEKMYQAMNEGNDWADAITLLSQKSWVENYQPALYEIGRNYYFAQNDKAVMYFNVEYGETGALQATIWKPDAEGNLVILHGNSQKVTLLPDPGNRKSEKRQIDRRIQGQRCRMAGKCQRDGGLEAEDYFGVRKLCWKI